MPGLQADEIDANGSSIPFLLNSLDHAVACFFGSIFGLRLQFILLFNPQVKRSILHLLLSNEKKSKIFAVFDPCNAHSAPVDECAALHQEANIAIFTDALSNDGLVRK